MMVNSAVLLASKLKSHYNSFDAICLKQTQ